MMYFRLSDQYKNFVITHNRAFRDHLDNYQLLWKCIMTYRPIARQRLTKRTPAEADARSNRTSIARQRISKQALSTIERLCFLNCSCRGVMKGQKGRLSYQKLREFSWKRVHLSELLPRNGSSSEDGSLRRLRRNDKKWIRLWQEHFMYDLKLQWDGYKSVAGIRLVKTENRSACVTVNCIKCGNSDTAVLPVIPSCVNKVSINPII
jgi:hypothetical protein